MTTDSTPPPAGSKWSLATQLHLGFAVALVLAIGATAGARWVAVDYEHEITGAYDTQLATTVQLAEAQAAFWQLRFASRQFVLEGPDGQRRILEQRRRLHEIIEDRLAAYDRTASSPDERQTLTGLRAAYRRYDQAGAKFIELWQAGDKRQADAWLDLAILPFGTQAGKAFETQIALQRSFAELARARSAAKARSALTLMTAMTAALLAMLALAYVHSLRLLRPIRALRSNAERMVREQLGESIEPSTRRNEVAALVESFDLMSERLAARTEALRESRERLDFLLRVAPVVIYSGRAFGDYAPTFISENVRELTGHDAEKFIADPGFWPSQIHPDDRDRIAAALAGLERRGSLDYEYRLRRSDGSWLWTQSRMILVRDAAGAPRERVGYWIDITERKRSEAVVAQALRMKSEFMNNMTHELRTPLHSVIGFAGLLKDEVPGPLNARQAEFTADILASGERLLALVEAILEMSRLEVDDAALGREPVDIGAALDERMSAQRKAAAAGAVTLELDVAPDAGSLVVGAKALRRMIDALLDNAIKFNREGGTVVLSARRSGAALEIAVADTGIGIAADDRAKLFKPLSQLDAGLARRHGGVGLGLALARRLAELQGAAIEVESEPGKGSRFTLRFPIPELS